MAVTDVQIAKLALNHLGDRYDITTLSEQSPEAEQVNLVFDNVRDALIRQYPWTWSLRYSKPAALVGTPPAGWAYMYVYPADALKVWRIVNPLDPAQDSLPPLPFRVVRNNSDVHVIVTNETEPEFEYSKRVTNTFEWDSLFDMALSWAIASHIAMPITGDTTIADRVTRKAQIEIGNAMREDGNEGVSRKQSRDPDWIRMR